MGFISGRICVPFDHSLYIGAAFDRQSTEQKDSGLGPHRGFDLFGEQRVGGGNLGRCREVGGKVKKRQDPAS